MKKLKVLQFLIYLVFGLLIIHDILPGFTRGFMDGLRDGTNQAKGQPAQTQLLPATLKGDMLTPHNNGFKINADYTLQHIYINTDVQLSTGVQPDKVLTTIGTVLILTVTVLLILIAVNTNNMVISIVNGKVFEGKTIRYLRRIGFLLLTYSVVDIADQRIDIAVLRSVIHGPLKVYNTTAFNFEVVICAILVFIAAEAFKYGAQLKAEQELVI